MSSSIISWLSQLWIFSLFKKLDDLRTSNILVSRLSIPEQAKQFVFAFPEPENGSVLYLVTVQNLSEQSIRDAEQVIKNIQPDAVIAQISPSCIPEILVEDNRLDNLTEFVPTSSYGVLKRCFSDKFNRREYEKLAGSLLLGEIFGTSFHGHVLVSKRAAQEVNAEFLLLEYPNEGLCFPSNVDDKIEDKRTLLASNFLLPARLRASALSNSDMLCLFDPIQSHMLNTVSQSLSLSIPMLESLESDGSLDQSLENYHHTFHVPSFAKTVYQLLSEIHDIFYGLPCLKMALVYAQKLLSDINKGVPADAQLLKEVHNFRVAIEGLRIAFNSAGRVPLYELKKTTLDFSLLSPEEKCNALFSQTLRSQAKHYKSVVAIVDASALSSIRKHWDTTVPVEVLLLAEQGFIKFNEEHAYEGGMTILGSNKRRLLLADTPMVAVGAGATAALGATSLSKVLPASTLVKIVSYKIPAIFKFGFAHVQRSAAVGLSKILTSTKILAPGVASKASAVKVSVSADNIRRLTHGFIASAERTSLLAMRTAFYEIMRKRNVRPVRFAPWATFLGSSVTCASLLTYGDGIECAAESLPSAPIIASWGRGLESLHQVSQQVAQTNKTKVQEALQSLMGHLKKMKVQ